MDWPYFLPAAAATCAALTTQAIDTQFCLKYHASIMSLSASLDNPQSRRRRRRHPHSTPCLIFDNEGEIGVGRASETEKKTESIGELPNLSLDYQSEGGEWKEGGGESKRQREGKRRGEREK